MTFLDRALPLAERGFRVFPLIPKQKRPLAMQGEYDHFDVPPRTRSRFAPGTRKSLTPTWA